VKDENTQDEKRVIAWNEQSVTVTVRETVICNNAAGRICLSFKNAQMKTCPRHSGGDRFNNCGYDEKGENEPVPLRLDQAQ
jgi:hypothetical protein